MNDYKTLHRIRAAILLQLAESTLKTKALIDADNSPLSDADIYREQGISEGLSKAQTIIDKMIEEEKR